MNSLILGSKEYPLGTNIDDTSPSGGMEVYIEELVNHLNEYSDITIITRKFSKTKKHEKNKNIEIWRVPWLNGFFLRNPTFNLSSFIKSLRLNYDVIISHGEISNFFSFFLSKINRKPLIMVNHGRASEQEQYNLLVKTAFSVIDKITYKRATVITHAPSKIPKDVEYNYVKPGFNRSKLKKDKSLLKKYKTKGLVILFTGRLMKTKGVEFLIQALKELKIPYTCFIVGDGSERENLENLSKELKTNVIFTGFRKDINKFLSIADVFVMPSLTEALNYSMLEAAYMKVPIIATDLGIFPRNTFIKIEKRNSKSISSSLKNINDKTVKNAYKFTKEFDWKIGAKQYYKIITKILEEKK